MKLAVISDTHGYHDEVQLDTVDVLIHCGDAANDINTPQNIVEMQKFILWFAKQNAKYKIYVPGNHDVCLYRNCFDRRQFLDNGIILLEHNVFEIENKMFFGSPYTPTYGNNWGYNVPRHKLHEYWQQIPETVDVIITHGPPKGKLDLTYDLKNPKNIAQVGCKALAKRIAELNPKYHFFGHIHDEPDFQNHGVYYRNDCTTYANAALIRHKPDVKIVNTPLYFTL